MQSIHLKFSSYRDAEKSLARPGSKQANVIVRRAWISFGALPCRKRNLMTARVSILLKSRASLTCFWACFLPGRAKDLSAPRYNCMRYTGSSRSNPLFLRAYWADLHPSRSTNLLVVLVFECVLFLYRSYALIKDSSFIKFVGHNPKVSHCRHVCNFLYANYIYLSN